MAKSMALRSQMKYGSAKPKAGKAKGKPMGNMMALAKKGCK